METRQGMELARVVLDGDCEERDIGRDGLAPYLAGMAFRRNADAEAALREAVRHLSFEEGFL